MPKAQVHGCAVLLIAEHCTPGSKKQSLSVGAWGQGVTQDSSFQVWVSNTGGHTVRCMYTSLPEKGTQIKPQQRLHVSVLHTWRASAKQFFPYYQKSTWNGKKKKKKPMKKLLAVVSKSIALQYVHQTDFAFKYISLQIASVRETSFPSPTVNLLKTKTLSPNEIFQFPSGLFVVVVNFSLEQNLCCWILGFGKEDS